MFSLKADSFIEDPVSFPFDLTNHSWFQVRDTVTARVCALVFLNLTASPCW